MKPSRKVWLRTKYLDDVYTIHERAKIAKNTSTSVLVATAWWSLRGIVVPQHNIVMIRLKGAKMSGSVESRVIEACRNFYFIFFRCMHEHKMFWLQSMPEFEKCFLAHQTAELDICLLSHWKQECVLLSIYSHTKNARISIPPIGNYFISCKFDFDNSNFMHVNF